MGTSYCVPLGLFLCGVVVIQSENRGPVLSEKKTKMGKFTPGRQQTPSDDNTSHEPLVKHHQETS